MVITVSEVRVVPRAALYWLTAGSNAGVSAPSEIVREVR